MEIVISTSIKNEKFDAKINGTKKISFGDSHYNGFTTHKDKERKDAYANHHKKNEDWTKSGAKAAGFWSRHILWAKLTIKESIDDIHQKFEFPNVKMK